jgi:hypothetical protein
MGCDAGEGSIIGNIFHNQTSRKKGYLFQCPRFVIWWSIRDDNYVVGLDANILQTWFHNISFFYTGCMFCAGY